MAQIVIFRSPHRPPLPDLVFRAALSHFLADFNKKKVSKCSVDHTASYKLVPQGLRVIPAQLKQGCTPYLCFCMSWIFFSYLSILVDITETKKSWKFETLTPFRFWMAAIWNLGGYTIKTHCEMKDHLRGAIFPKLVLPKTMKINISSYFLL